MIVDKQFVEVLALQSEIEGLYYPEYLEENYSQIGRATLREIIVRMPQGDFGTTSTAVAAFDNNSVLLSKVTLPCPPYCMVPHGSTPITLSEFMAGKP